MRIRIRGPSGQSTVNLDASATVETLRKTIATETNLSRFDIKYGYPPKSLSLDQYPPSQLLEDLNVKLNGEQLIVSKSESAPAQTVTPKPDIVEAAVANSSRSPQAGASRAAYTNETYSPESKQPSRPATGSAPLALSRKSNPEMLDPPEIYMPELDGNLVLRIMPDDNSCLFRAVATAVISDIDTMTELRSMIAQTIQANPDKYTKVILDNKDPDSYCQWIQTEDAWGGQIELDILSQQFDIEICSIDVQSLRVDKYNEGASRRCIVVYSGIHYDTIAFSLPGMPPEDDIKQFEAPVSDKVLPSAIALCKKLKEKHYYTDTAAFRLKCGDCGAICIGETGATEHATKTGHYNFGEAS